MEKNICTTNGHQYGLWQIENELEVSRTCKECHLKEKLPVTKESLKEIRKQKEAEILIKKFLTIPNYDNNIMGFTYLILDDYINYTDDTLKSALIKKLNEIILTSLITEENKQLLENFKLAITQNNGELFDNTMTLFEEHNLEYIESPILETNQNFSK